MNITRHNYEEFFLLYIDNELSVADRRAVEEFAAQNPDLKGELEMLQQSLFRPDKDIVFDYKDALLQPVVNQSGINSANYESFFVLYADNELGNHEKAAVEDFVYRNPQFQAEFELLQQVKLEPDNSIVFANKESLYRKEEDEKVVPIIWWRWMAAAIVLIIAGAFWIMTSSKKKETDFAEGKAAKQNITAPVPAIKKADDAVKDQKENTAPENVAVIDEQQKKENVKEDAIKKAVEGPSTNRKEEQQLAVTTQRQQKQQRKEDAIIGQQTDVEPVDENGVNPSSTTVASNNIPRREEIGTKNIAVTGSISVNIIDQPTGVNELDTDNDKTYILNTSVTKQNGLRGFFRKASRVIAKTTNLGNGDNDGNRKGILIGGFEIAVK